MAEGHQMSAWAEAMIDALRMCPNNSLHFGFAFWSESGRGGKTSSPSCIFVAVPHVEDELLRQWVNPGAKVLDVGCGIGRHLRWIRANISAVQLFATESDPTLREKCAVDVAIVPCLEDVRETGFDVVLLLGGNLGLGGTEKGTREMIKTMFDKMAPGGILIAEGSSPSPSLFREPFTPGTATISYKGRSDPPFPWCFCSQGWVLNPGRKRRG